MDPIEKLTSMNNTKKLVANKDLQIKGEALKSIGNHSQENFFRKTQKSIGLSKAEAYGTIIQIMKSDIFQIQEMINDFSYITKMFKLSSRTTFTSKKISEIDESRDVKSLIDKITEDSSTAEKLAKAYSSQNSNDLILKMGLELNLYETFIKKINELFFVLNLKINGEENSQTISQESFSKFFVVKLVLEKMIEKSSNTYINDTDTSISSVLLSNSQSNFNKKDLADKQGISQINFSSQNDSEKNKKIDEYEKLKLVNNLNELLELENIGEKDNIMFPLIKHLCHILKDFLGKLGIGYAELLAKYSASNKKDLISLDSINNTGKPSFANISMENLLSQKLFLEKLLIEKDKLINNVNNNFNITSIQISNEALLAKANEDKKKLEKEIEVLKATNQKALIEIQTLAEKSKEQKLKYEEEILKLKTSQPDTSSQADMFTISESKKIKYTIKLAK